MLRRRYLRSLSNQPEQPTRRFVISMASLVFVMASFVLVSHFFLSGFGLGPSNIFTVLIIMIASFSWWNWWKVSRPMSLIHGSLGLALLGLILRTVALRLPTPMGVFFEAAAILLWCASIVICIVVLRHSIRGV